MVSLAAARQEGERRGPEARSEVEAQAEARPAERPIFGRDRLSEVTSIADLVIYSPKVAEELKLSPEDRKAIVDAVSESAPNMTPLRNRLRSANSWVANGLGKREALDQAKGAVEDAEAKRAEVVRARLSRSQYRRLLQIAIQQKGYRSLTTPDVASAVELAPEQEQAIRAILVEREAERAALVERAQGRIDPAAERRYESILQKERAQRPLTDDEKDFMRRWFDAKEERARHMEKFEDQIDSRIFNVLNRYQKGRFRALVGDLVETEGPASKSPAAGSAGGQGRDEGSEKPK